MGILNLLEFQCISSSFSLNCTSNPSQCRSTKIQCMENEDCYIWCNAMESCLESEIMCPENGDCSISCDGDISCKHLKARGPTNGHLVVNCNDERSCFGAMFDGSHSSRMTINGCIKYAACFDVAIYCPPNTNQSANCFVHGNDYLGSDVRIYAINGWQDIEIDYTGFFGVYHEGSMFCGNHYEIECNIASNDWSCDGTDHVEDICKNKTIQSVQTTEYQIVIDRTEILPDLSEDGSMGMLVIAGGLIGLAVFCIVCGIFKQKLIQIKKSWNRKKAKKQRKASKNRQKTQHELNAKRIKQKILEIDD